MGLLVSKLANECNKRGNIAIVCAISHVKQTRAQIREHLAPDFMEVYLDCPVEVCADRDIKGHYQKALAGEYENFIGVTEPYQLSDQPELILDTVNQSVDQCADILVQYTLKFFDLVCTYEHGTQSVARATHICSPFIDRLYTFFCCEDSISFNSH